MSVRALLTATVPAAAILTVIAAAVACSSRAPLTPLTVARADEPAPSLLPTGWTVGQVAAGTADLLAPVEPLDLAIPVDIAARIGGPTALFYFSPSCPHCQAVMSEVNALADTGETAWLGIAHGGASHAELALFEQTYGPRFPIVVDSERAFAMSVGARSTPSVYLVEPAPSGATGPDGEPLGEGAVRFVEAYAPFARGMGAVLTLRRHPEAPYAGFVGYQGDVVCEACHIEEADAHSLTHHSVAYRTLYQRDRAEDLHCVGCHVTGMDKAGRTSTQGGFVVGDHGSPFNRVGCEACHGPGGPHDGERIDARTTCVGCHDAEHSIAFTVEKGLPHIDHFAANGLSETELRERLVALGTGEGGRPLLAFPEGPTVGAAACKECHKPEHKWWRKEAHTRALETLRTADIEGAAVAPITTPACINCHATQAAYGGVGTPDSLDGFRLDEGVGCEACHGPGGPHCEQPTADNIVGLGDSCPECVIEAVCTSCHVPAWDPGWELKKRLEAVAH